MEDARLRTDLESLPAAYAAWRQSALGRITDALEQELVLDLAGPVQGRRILDVGCGDGALLAELARRSARTVGIDASPRMIAAARGRGRERGDDALFAVGRAETLPFAAARFDLVIAVTVLCFLEDPTTALLEMSRVLEPGGRLIVGELGRHSSWAAIRRVKGWLGSSVWRRARFRSAAELRRLAAAAGLVDATIHGAVYYPPSGLAARLLGPLDRRMAARTTAGAAFLVLAARRPRQDACEVRDPLGRR